MTNFVLLRQQMIANDMQQKDIAEAAGLSRSAFSARMGPGSKCVRTFD